MNKIKLFLFSLLLITPIHADQAADEALLDAARAGNIDEAKTALDNGANINCTDLVQGLPYYTPLMLATLHNRSPMVSFLISQRANVTQQSEGNSDTALAIAFRFNRHSIILKLLIDGNARAEQIFILFFNAKCYITELLEKKPGLDTVDEQITQNIFAMAILNTKEGRSTFQGLVVKAALVLENEFQQLIQTQEFQNYPQEFQAQYKEFVTQHQKQLRNPRSLRELICAQVKRTLEKEEVEQFIQKMREEECRIRTTPASDASQKEPSTPQDAPAAHGWFDRCSIQ